MISLSDKNFDETIKKNQKPVLVDFFADWCPPCKALSPILEKLESEFGENIIFAKVNVDESPLTAQKFGINPIPTVILLKGDEPMGSFVGLIPEEEIRNWLLNLLK